MQREKKEILGNHLNQPKERFDSKASFIDIILHFFHKAIYRLQLYDVESKLLFLVFENY